jgi:hypothetical protein
MAQLVVPSASLISDKYSGFSRMAMQKYWRAALLVVASCVASPAMAQEPLLTLEPQHIQAAIQLAGDDKATRAFLDAYALQSRAGWGNGPLIGSISTPFSRVVQAAVMARKKGRQFAPTDVTPELISPELHVVAVSQPAATDDAVLATVKSVSLVSPGANTVKPTHTSELTREYQDFNGTMFERPGVVAIFPMTALGGTNEVRIFFDRVARGSNALTGCRECTVPLNMTRIK